MKNNTKFKVLSFIAIMAFCFGALTLTLHFSGFFEGIGDDKDTQKKDIAVAQEAPTGNEGDNAPSPPPENTESKDTEQNVKQRKEATKELAKKFAEAYYNYDAANHMAYIEASKPYITDKFYNYLQDNPRRNPLTRIKTTAKQIEMYPVEGDSEYETAWNAIITGEAVSSDGSKTKEQSSLWIVLKKEDSTWKVKGATFDAR